jgi:hypothetical protein
MSHHALASTSKTSSNLSCAAPRSSAHVENRPHARRPQSFYGTLPTHYKRTCISQPLGYAPVRYPSILPAIAAVRTAIPPFALGPPVYTVPCPV